MIELSIKTRNTAPPPLATPVSAGAPGGFARAMDAISDAPQPSPPITEPRQGDADGGKELPAIAAEPAASTPARPVAGRRHARATAEPVPPLGALPFAPPTAKPSSDSDDAAVDADTSTGEADKNAPTITFFAMPATPIVIDPAKLPAPAFCGADPGIAGAALPVARAAPAAPAAPVALDASLSAASTLDALTVTPPPKSTTTPAVAFELLDPGTPAKVTSTPTDPAEVTAPRIEARTDTPRFTIAGATTTTDPASVAVLPARQAFATALAALSIQASTRARARDDESADSLQPIAGLVAPAAGTLLQNAVQQVAAGDQAALDPRHDRGLHGMIDHIEMLRDDANARDTRIRLTPDALGTVDVALRRDGDAVHVRFSSANEATRLVLNDAQPRLAALAEARGVRIAGSSIDSGANDAWGGGGQPQPQPRTELPRPARAVAAADTDIPADQRLA